MDGYGRIYAAMRSAARDELPGSPLLARIGEVLSVEPLTVDVGGTTQEAGRFYVAKRLLSGDGQPAEIEKGDMVLLLTDDDQTFYLIDKVVRP